MFKREKLDDAILFDDMEKNLKKNALAKDTRGENFKLQVYALLDKAASCFEQANLIKEAEAVTRVVEHLNTKVATDNSGRIKQIDGLKTKFQALLQEKKRLEYDYPDADHSNADDLSDSEQGHMVDLHMSASEDDNGKSVEDNLYETLMKDPKIQSALKEGDIGEEFGEEPNEEPNDFEAELAAMFE